MRIFPTGIYREGITPQVKSNHFLNRPRFFMGTLYKRDRSGTSGSIAGFTLIELIIVIFIISLTTALVMPSLWRMGDRALKSEAKQIGNTLRYIYDEAAGKKQTYLLIFDLDSDSWRFESKIESRAFKLKETVMFKDIMIPSHGKVSFGEIKLIFPPTGPEEPVTLHLIKDNDEYTVMFNHLSGRAKIYKGYVDEVRS